MILFEQTYEREGNDSWLIDIVEIHSDAIGLSLVHKHKWTGWVGDDKGSRIIELDAYDLMSSQEKVNNFLKEESLYREFPSGAVEGIREIDLVEIFNNRR